MRKLQKNRNNNKKNNKKTELKALVYNKLIYDKIPMKPYKMLHTTNAYLFYLATLLLSH